MRTSLLLTLVCVGLATPSIFAQDSTATDSLPPKPWKVGGATGVTFSQTTLSNWAGGGNNAISLNAYQKLFANLTKGRSNWENSLDLGYGLLKQEGQGAQKTDDLIDLLSKYGYQLSATNKHWFLSSVINFRTQFANGFSYPNDSVAISRFMAPAYLFVTPGIEYKRGDVLSVLFAPASAKMTFVNVQRLADSGAYGVEPAEFDALGNKTKNGERTRLELGGALRVQYKQEVLKNFLIDSKLDLFSNYVKKPENIDVNWQTSFILKVNTWLSTNLFTHMIYDDDVDVPIYNEDNVQIGEGPRLQYKQVFGIGITFKY